MDAERSHGSFLPAANTLPSGSLPSVASRSVASPSAVPDPLTPWLLSEGRTLAPDAFPGALARRLAAAGVPVDRLMLGIETSHSGAIGLTRVWERGADGRETTGERLLPHGAREKEEYTRSPFHDADRTGEWIAFDIAATPHDRYGVVPELKRGGHRHYLLVPYRFSDGRRHGLALATRSPRGFGPAAHTIVALMLPALSLVLELQAERWRAHATLATYVGHTPAERIGAGTILRGEVERIEAAILFADMRDFTKLTAGLSPEATVDLLDRYFDCLVPAVRENGGEVLKFMGDGLLAAFRVEPGRPASWVEPGNLITGSSPTAREAVAGALRAAREAMACVAAMNEGAVSEKVRSEETKTQGAGNDGPGANVRPLPGPIEVGIALHFGEAAYGNVGSQDRLDFTVVGHDVNVASRIARLNRVLDEPILISAPFAALLDDPGIDLGTHGAAGISEPLRVHRPGG